MSDNNYSQIKVSLPNHWAASEEYLWVTHIEDDLYRIENIPFYAYGVNFQDVVSVTPAKEEGGDPEIAALKEWGGHQTMRLFFADQITDEQQEQLIAILADNNIIHQRANKYLIAIDIPPGLDAGSVYDFLEDNSGDERFSFETCEERMPNSFDDGV